MGFPRQEYWSGLLLPPPSNVPGPGIELVSPAWQAYSLPLSHLENTINDLATQNFQMYKLDFQKAEEPEIKLPASTGSPPEKSVCSLGSNS